MSEVRARSTRHTLIDMETVRREVFAEVSEVAEEAKAGSESQDAVPQSRLRLPLRQTDTVPRQIPATF